MSELVHLLRGPRSADESTYCGARHEARTTPSEPRCPARKTTHPTEATCLRCLSTAVEALERELADALRCASELVRQLLDGANARTRPSDG